MNQTKEEDGLELGFPVDLVPDRREEIAIQVPQPWHKPRKQWVRREQWTPQIAELLGDLQLAGREFRYLTLPGEHLFDVRHLHSLFAQRQVKLRFLGFDTSRKSSNATVSEHEVRNLPFVHGDSVILGDRFEDIGDPGSMAFASAEKFSSFDAVNLDLCDSVASRRTHPNDSSLNAILRLLELQANNRTEPWLLFITTRAGRESVNSQVMAKLLSILQDNVTRNASFRRGVDNTGLFRADVIDGERGGTVLLSPNEFTCAFGVGLSKWLLSLAKDHWTVSQRTAAGYRVVTDGDSPDMLSLVFRFDRIPVSVSDPNRVVTSRPTQIGPVPTVLEMEMAFLEVFNDLIDLDALIDRDVKLREQMIQENADLMSLARFDRDQIVSWGHDACWRPR
jgi:hypothetical protein